MRKAWTFAKERHGCERAQEGGGGEERRLACGAKDAQRVHVEQDADPVTGNADHECCHEELHPRKPFARDERDGERAATGAKGLDADDDDGVA